MYGAFFQIEAFFFSEKCMVIHDRDKIENIPRALAKFCFLRIVLNREKISLY